MDVKVKIIGQTSLIHHSGAGIDPSTPAAREIREITAKRGGNRTDVEEIRLRELECQRSIWLDGVGDKPTIPPQAFRAAIETAARKVKQGPMVREGLTAVDAEFIYDTDRYGSTLAELGQTTQFVTGVVVQRSRVLRTRAKFDCPWQATFLLDIDLNLVSEQMLAAWCEIAGQRIGIGDWRPEKSGHYGRFSLDDIWEVK